MSDEHFVKDGNAEDVDKLVHGFTEVVEKRYRDNCDLNPGDIMLACLFMVMRELVSVECPGCRRASIKHIKKVVPEMLRDAAVQAAKLDAEHDVHPAGHLH
jgi:hypothetical protein